MDVKENECLSVEAHEKRVKQAKGLIWADEDLERACNTFRVLGEPSRMKIVLALQSGEMCVYHIVQACGGNQSAVSHQLRILKDNGVLKARREGQNILYSIADGHIYELIQTSSEHLSCREN
mgnify:CR=1 FL=1